MSSVDRIHVECVDFVIARPPFVFSVELAGLPNSHQGGAYQLEADGEMFRGRVPASGKIEHDLRRPVQTATLRIEPTDPGTEEEPASPLEYEFQLGHLDPATEVTGVQGRLANLGYYEGTIDGVAEQHTRAAVAEFRRAETLPEDEAIDAGLSERLRERHGV